MERLPPHGRKGHGRPDDPTPHRAGSEDLHPSRSKRSLGSNADSTQWTLKLRPGVKFGNGDPLTAQAVQFSLDRLATSLRAAAGMAQQIASMQVVDVLTIVFTLSAHG
jgi:peptide/nickel transport system substrate-binding protein